MMFVCIFCVFSWWSCIVVHIYSLSYPFKPSFWLQWQCHHQKPSHTHAHITCTTGKYKFVVFLYMQQRRMESETCILVFRRCYFWTHPCFWFLTEREPLPLLTWHHQHQNRLAGKILLYMMWWWHHRLTSSTFLVCLFFLFFQLYI